MLFFSQCWFGSVHAPTHLPSIPSRSFSCSAGVLPSRPSARGAFRAGLLTMHQPGIPKVRGFWIGLPLQHKNLEWDVITSSGGCRQSYCIRGVLNILILGAWYLTEKISQHLWPTLARLQIASILSLQQLWFLPRMRPSRTMWRWWS